MIGAPELGVHLDDRDRPVLLWRLDAPARSISSAPLGGGMGERDWIVNAQVDLHYDRTDPEVHLAEIGGRHGLAARGVGMLTAADLTPGHGEDGGVQAWATVGVTTPTWAADADGVARTWAPGTINLVVAVPVALSDAALVNAVITATEAKTQALLEAGVPGTGTASDAVCILVAQGGPAEPFGGPRSPWGARLARAVHGAVQARLP